jgi:acetyl/propionyl-CoA carboxylase alpha subunit/acetyl-CoA carboxylase carboxyltransferase component
VTFHRVAIVNRGEPAMRFLNAVAELNRARTDQLTTIAVYAEPDRHAWFVREADEAVCIGPATARDERTGREQHTYLDHARLEKALVEARADAVWVGWGFVSEDAEFAELCEKLGVVFIGPTSDAMHRVGDKIGAKRLAEAAGVPVVPWSGGPLTDLAEAAAAADRLGYPLFVKATSGGGGRGIRLVERRAELADALAAAMIEARHAFGDPTVFLEQRLTDARHLEVQMIADQHGGVLAVGLRDCTLQRRHQKVLEESGCPLLGPATEAELRHAAVELCRHAGYSGAGTVEFLYLPESRRFYFLEVNARLQVEHPVTELTTGLDLVKLQLAVARGERLATMFAPQASLSGPAPVVSGHAIEVRLNAEDPDNGFAPAPGRIRRFRVPVGPGVRVDTGVTEGDEIVPEFDSMIAKVLAWGSDREEARTRLARALTQTQVIVEGGRTNRSFLLALLDHPDVVASRYDTAWLDARMTDGTLLESRHADVALVTAAVEAYAVAHADARTAFYAAVARGRPAAQRDGGRRMEFRYRGERYQLDVHQHGPNSYRVGRSGSAGGVEVDVEQLGDVERRLTFPGRSHRVLTALVGPTHTVEVDGATHTITRSEGGVVRSPTPAVVVSVTVAPGDEVAVGDPLVVLECMKLETAVRASYPGRVRAVLVVPNTQVDAGDPLLRLEPAAGADEVRPAGAVSVDLGCDEPSWGPDALRSYLLGYDLDATTVQRIERGDDPWVGTSEDERGHGEAEILGLFVDVCAVSRRQPEPADEVAGEHVRAPEEHLLTCLRTYETGGGTLPRPFLRRLESVLSHHGVDRLGPGTEVEDSLMRLYRAQHRLDTVRPVVAAVLNRWLTEGRMSGVDQRELLDHLAATTERRYPDLMDLARDVRFRFFEQPVLASARASRYAEMDRHIAALAAGVAAQERVRLMAALIDCPQPLRPVLLRWYQRGSARERDVALEVAVRRYYRIRELSGVELVDAEGFRLAVADYRHLGHHHHLMVACAPADRLAAVASAAAQHLAGVPSAARPILDLHVWTDDALDDADTVSDRLRDVLAAARFGRAMHRIDVTITDNHTYHFAFRPTPDGLVEDPLYRNMHPMLAKRLHLERLSRFAITRLDSAEDVYLFHGIARDNPRDERLFALAEVRDLTPAPGEPVSLPLLERIMAEVFSGMRRFQSHRLPEQRLVENVVLLQVRPLWTFQVELWRDLAHRMAPALHGLGIAHVLAAGRVAGSDGKPRDVALDVTNPGARGVVVHEIHPSNEPIEPLDEYGRRVLRARRRGDVYPYELIRLLTPPAGATSDFPAGEFVEYDLTESNTGSGALVPVSRAPGGNTANLVVGLISNTVPTISDGMRRVLIAGDPSRSLGSLAEPECRRIVAAINLAERLGVPVEWFAVSSGARISMDSGTENMDWIGAVLKRIITFTQTGGEINVVVTGINVGAQPYWNAEATMLMHTRGILVMLPESAMVLTGKQALDFSGGVSAEDNLGIGGFERVMGPNGQAQYHAADLESACELLFRHYAHTYVVPGERFPRRAATTDPADRDVRESPHTPCDGSDFRLVGDIFSTDRNPERKKPFDIRSVMRAVSDLDHAPLERWGRWQHADTAVVWDAHLGGIPVCLIGLESHPVAREGRVPGDGPATWTSGTLFPQSSKKVARAVNAASGNRPVVVLANLSGFDGSPESMRSRQLEYGAEIGRAVTNFDGPIVFVVVSRYHGGAFVVFSKQLNDNLEVVAVDGAYASVIGGAPAAAVVFTREVRARTAEDPRVTHAAPHELRAVTEAVRSEKLGEVASEFDHVHSIDRALDVGSVDRIIRPEELRPHLVAALERGIGFQS